jgi:hypothetical protein
MGDSAAGRRASGPKDDTEWPPEGKSPVLVKEAMGHSDIRTTMGYTHLAKEHLRALVEAPFAKREEAAS